MSKQGLIAGLIAVVVVAAVVGGILLSTRKNRVELQGEFLKVRSHALDPEHTVALIDVRLTNPSTQQFLVKDLDVFVDDASGKPVKADVYSDVEIQRVVEYYPVLGKKYNQGLIRHDKINSGQSVDRTVSINIPLSDEQLARRKGIRIEIHDTDGPTIEVSEHK